MLIYSCIIGILPINIVEDVLVVATNLFAVRYKKHFEINMRDNSNQSGSQEDAFTHKEF